jgi:putative aldouronate transport system substrate-binding protein
MKKKLLAMGLVFAMTVSMFVGCGQKETSETAAPSAAENEADATVEQDAAVQEQVTINVVHRNVGEQPAQAEVIDAMNAYSSEKIGVTINYTEWTGGEYKEKANLALASKEDYDLMFQSSGMTGFVTNAQDGAFMDLTDLIPKYEGLKNVVSEGDWESVKVKGDIYLVPNKKEAFLGYTMVTPKELADTIKEKYGVDFNEIECNSINDIGNFTEYLMACKDEGVAIPIATLTSFDALAGTDGKYEKVAWPYAVDKETRKIVNYLETEEFANYEKLMREWKELGLWPEEVLLDDYNGLDYCTSGDFGITGWSTVPDNKNSYESRYNYEVYMADFTKNYVINTSNTMSGWSIPNYSEKADAALRWLELLQTDQKFADMFVYGVEGKQFNYTADGLVELVPDSGWSNGVWKTTNYWTPSLTTTDAPDKVEQYEQYNSSAIMYDSIGFYPDWTEVEGEKTNIDAVAKEFHKVLMYGFGDDSTLAVTLEQMNKAGNEKIKTELQSQLDSFFASK